MPTVPESPTLTITTLPPQFFSVVPSSSGNVMRISGTLPPAELEALAIRLRFSSYTHTKLFLGPSKSVEMLSCRWCADLLCVGRRDAEGCCLRRRRKKNAPKQKPSRAISARTLIIVLAISGVYEESSWPRESSLTMNVFEFAIIAVRLGDLGAHRTRCSLRLIAVWQGRNMLTVPRYDLVALK
jgi:hypothetical protein